MYPGDMTPTGFIPPKDWTRSSENNTDLGNLSRSPDGGGEARKKKKANLNKACFVCGAPAAEHVHYGAICCYSCRAFFRRSGARNYQCIRGDLQCEVNTKFRKYCKKCRYLKCLEVGMKPELVDASLRTKEAECTPKTSGKSEAEDAEMMDPAAGATSSVKQEGDSSCLSPGNPQGINSYSRSPSYSPPHNTTFSTHTSSPAPTDDYSISSVFPPPACLQAQKPEFYPQPSYPPAHFRPPFPHHKGCDGREMEWDGRMDLARERLELQRIERERARMDLERARFEKERELMEQERARIEQDRRDIQRQKLERREADREMVARDMERMDLGRQHMERMIMEMGMPPPFKNSAALAHHEARPEMARPGMEGPDIFVRPDMEAMVASPQYHQARPDMRGQHMDMGGMHMTRPDMGSPYMARPEMGSPYMARPDMGSPYMAGPDMAEEGPDMRKINPDTESVLKMSSQVSTIKMNPKLQTIERIPNLLTDGPAGDLRAEPAEEKDELCTSELCDPDNQQVIGKPLFNVSSVLESQSQRMSVIQGPRKTQPSPSKEDLSKPFKKRNCNKMCKNYFRRFLFCEPVIKLTWEEKRFIDKRVVETRMLVSMVQPKSEMEDDYNLGTFRKERTSAIDIFRKSFAGIFGKLRGNNLSELEGLGLVESRFLCCALTSIAVRLFGGTEGGAIISNDYTAKYSNMLRTPWACSYEEEEKVVATLRQLGELIGGDERLEVLFTTCIMRGFQDPRSAFMQLERGNRHTEDNESSQPDSLPASPDPPREDLYDEPGHPARFKPNPTDARCACEDPNMLTGVQFSLLMYRYLKDGKSQDRAAEAFKKLEGLIKPLYECQNIFYYARLPV